MANMLFANNCNTTLSSSLTNVATSMSVTSATGFPVPTGSQYFYCTLADAATQTTIEIVKVTAVSGTTFTIVRGQDGTTGTIFASGAVVSLRLVRASLQDFPLLDEANTFTGPSSTFNNAPSFGTALGAASGGTGQTSYAVGDILYASTTTALSKLADVATGNALISGGVGVAPSYGKIGLTTHISGTLAVGNGGTGITTTPSNGQIPIGNGANYTAATITAGTNIAVTNGSGSISIATNIPVPQVTTYTSGSGTYTVPSDAKYLIVEMCGGGGGGAGAGTGGGFGSGGSAGGNTTFGSSLLTANGGAGGTPAGGASNGGNGGTASLGGSSGIAITGGNGTGTSYANTSGLSGWPGGTTNFGGAGGSNYNTTTNSQANTGAGGPGGAGAAAGYNGSSGGSGGYVKATLTSLSSTYAYAVGSGGSGGAAGATGLAGGNGGSGVIIITAYF